MDPNFSFPRLAAPVPRPRLASTATASPEADNGPPNKERDSNALRASVLDVALQLGLGTNNAVANWMFSNSLEEEVEEDQRSPALTCGSTPSDDSNSFLRTPKTVPFPLATSLSDRSDAPLGPIMHSVTDPVKPMGVGNPPAAATIFPEIPIPPRPSAPSRGKLRKKRSDGFESDGGYVSESTKKKESKTRVKEEKKKEKEARKRAKSLFGSDKPSKKIQVDDRESSIGHAAGYETDGPAVKPRSKSKKSQTKTPDETGDETDSGFMSSSSKGRSKSLFSKLGMKRSKPDLRLDPLPLPSLDVEREVTPLPIASRFASTMPPTLSITPTPSFMPPRSIGEGTEDGSHLSFLSLTPSPVSTPGYLPSIVPAASPLSRPFQIEALSSLSNQRDSYGSADSESLSHSSSMSHRKSHGPSSLGHDSGPGFKRGQTVQPPVPNTSASSPRLLGSLSPPSISISPTLSETTLAAISAPSPRPMSAISHPSRPAVPPPVPSFSPGQIFQLPVGFASPVPAAAPSITNPQIPTRATPLVIPFTQAPGPAFLSPLSPSQAPPSPVPSPRRPRPRFPPTDGFGPRPATSPLTAAPDVASGGAPGQGRTSGYEMHGQGALDEARLQRVEQVSQPQPQLRGVTVVDPRLQSHLQVQVQGQAQVAVRRQASSPQPPMAQRPQADGVLSASPVHLRAHGPTAFTQMQLQPQIPQRQQRLSQTLPPPSPLIVPSEDYIVPSPHASPLPSPVPNVLAYYDIPPPSPPPAGPLPKPPPGSFGPGGGVVRERGLTRLNSLRNAAIGGVEQRPKDMVEQGQAMLRVKRGQESPFPQRPIIPVDFVGGAQGHRQGFEEKVKVPRYRELYALALPESREEKEREERRKMLMGETDERWEEESDIDEDDMRDVLARFEEARIGGKKGGKEEMGMEGGRALGRSRSFEAIQKMAGYEGDDAGSDADDQLDDEFSQEDFGRKLVSEEGGGDRNSRWSGSIYSRASFLDPDKSEETRERFLRRVEEMYWEDGREKGYGPAVVPPVPRLPAAYADERSRNRF